MHERIGQLKASGELPDNAEYLFDELDRLNGWAGEASEAVTVRKTQRRKVVTLKYGAFYAREVVRQRKTEGGQSQPISSSELARLVAPGCQYGYDLVAHVGLESFLYARRLEEIQRDLRENGLSMDLPLSSLDELRRRFLFYLGQVHRKAAPQLKESLRTAGRTWLIDGTLEPGTSVFFGVQHAVSNILLGCSKIPTENADDIVPCLVKTADEFGRPKRILHDLSSAMSLACQTAFSDVPHDVCHFHFARDVGDDLLAKPQNALSGRLRSLKLQVRMRDQRRTQTQWLREHNGEPEAALILQQLLRGAAFEGTWNETLGKEVLLAFHFWMLDYAADGDRQGFPFDPYFLYFHRRLLRGHDALERLLSLPAVLALAPQPLFNLRDQLQHYRNDTQILTAAAHYELAFQEFDRLRTALRLTATGNNPMHHGYELNAKNWNQVKEALKALGDEYRQRIDECSDELELNVCQTILTHIEKYSPQLASSAGSEDTARTTNDLERHWSASKRACRKTQGRRKLTRTFNALPAELMLIPNLRNAEYLTAALDGGLNNLAAKFADAHTEQSAYASWRKSNTSLNLGRIPARVLRQPDFVEQVIEIYDGTCQEKKRAA